MTPYLLVTGDFVTTGGMDRANYALASFLARQGHPVHLVAHRVAGDLLRLPNVHFHRVPKPFGSYTLGQPLLDHIGRQRAHDLQIKGGRVVVNGGNCRVGDINWVHYVHAAYKPTQAGGPLHRFKRAWDHRVALRMERRVLTQARLVIANSQRTRVDLVEQLGIRHERIRVVYYGSDPERFQPPTAERKAQLRRQFGWVEGRPVVAFVGALGDRRKGFDTVFAAWCLLCRDQSWAADLAVVGGGVELPLWRKRAGKAGLNDRIHFLGFRRDVPDLLAAGDLVVAPTRYEAYGLNVHEALCCGLPVLVSASAGVTEWYPASLSSLLLSDPAEPRDLANRLRRWQEDPDGLRKQILPLSNQLRCRTWDQMSEELIASIK